MKFRVLGSFEVVAGDRLLALGGFKQRAVLAILVLSPGRAVCADRLVEELWGGDPPRSAIGSLQAYVSNLRRVLEPDRPAREPARILRSDSAGYTLDVELDDIDAQRFERLAAEGHALVRSAQPEAAARTLREALNLWRGPALAEFRDEPFARLEAARLEELRANALDARVDADLALGGHDAVIPELQRLIADDPLRERLWARLILALYRSGRQAEALAAYRECRRSLAETLGIEPNPALRQLERDVLQQAASLEVIVSAHDAPGVRTGEASRVAHDVAAASLAYRDEAGSLQVFSLTPGGAPIWVGRGSSADLWLFWDRRVSRMHAKLEWDGAEWAVVDDETSANGSYVNGDRVPGRRVLTNDDRLLVGETELTFRLHRLAAEAETNLGTMLPPASD